MDALRLGRPAIGMFVAVALLAACATPQQLAVAPMQTNTTKAAPYRDCGAPPKNLGIEVLYPIPGTQNARWRLAALYFSAKQKPPHDAAFYLVDGLGPLAWTTNPEVVEESQIPEPHATPRYLNPHYYAAELFGTTFSGGPHYIGPNEHVKVFWSHGPYNCIPNVVVSTFKTRR